jgi:hydroxyacylglutathione hydrolase
MPIHIQDFCFNGFQENTFVVSDSEKNCVIIDPGCYEKHEEALLEQYIIANGLKPLALLNTHGHIDHVLGNHFILNRFEVPFYMHIDELSTWRSVEAYAHVYGFEKYTACSEPTHIMVENQTLQFGQIILEVLHTPGHSPGHVVYYNRAQQFVINGDVLFRGSFGRVDLPGGDLNTLKNSIHEVMFQLPEETIVFCGHGEQTSISEEKKNNYILSF